jgi:hypothetical protein
MKKLVDLGSHFNRFRDEAATLRGEVLILFCILCVSYLVFTTFLTFFFQRRYVVLRNAPMIWRPSSKPVKKLARGLRMMLPVSRICAEDFKPLKTL